MAKSDARFEYKAKLGRTDHNLSQPLGFTSASGMLLPIWFDLATPGDAYYMQHDLPLLRSIQFVAPSMVDVKVHYETFFVPMQMIYQPFENTIFSLKNLQSSLYTLGNQMNTAFPLFNYQSYVESILNSTTYNVASIHSDAFRLADLFGLNPLNFTLGSDLPNTYSPNFFPYQILAYNAIFQYYYRLDDKSQFTNIFFNIDKYYGTSVFTHPDVNFMKIHQRPWDFDYFMSVYRSPIVSDANLQSVLQVTSSPDSFLTNRLTASANKDNNINRPNSEVTTFTPVLSSGAATNVNSAVIRQLFANEKLSMITGRAKKNYDSQVLAHYGVNVPHDVKHDLTMIHHDEYDLTVQEVTSLASTSDAPLGELAGKSFSAGHGKQFKFTAPCHGVMMTIFSIEPKKRYITGFDRINSITTAFDVPTPEFDRLGNVPMYRYESGYQAASSSMNASDIIGWKERFYANKRKPSRATFAFYNQNGVNNFSSYFLSALPFGSAEFSQTSGLFHRNTNLFPRPDLEDRFYIERGAMDNMCFVPFYDGWKAEGTEGENWSNSPWLVYSRDPFIVNSHIKCKKVSWMSKDGEPVYNF